MLIGAGTRRAQCSGGRRSIELFGTRVAPEVRKALANPDIQNRWNEAGSDVPQMSQQEFAAKVDAEIERWGSVVKAANVKLE